MVRVMAINATNDANIFPLTYFYHMPYSLRLIITSLYKYNGDVEGVSPAWLGTILMFNYHNA